MSTEAQKRASELHGEAHKIARDEVPQELLDRLAAVAEGRDDLRVRIAGEIAGAWTASPATHQGHELIAAGLLLLSGPVDGDQLLDAVRTGYERGRGSLKRYDPSESGATTEWVKDAPPNGHAATDTRCCRCDAPISAGESVARLQGL